MAEPVYKDERAAILALVRIFGPCHLSEILLELRSLVKAKTIEVVPYSWALSKKGYVRHDVDNVLEELWIRGLIVKIENRYKAV